MVCFSFTNRKGFAIACDKTFKHFNRVYKNTITAMLNTFWFMVIETFETDSSIKQALIGPRCVVNTGALMIIHEFSGKINDFGKRNPLFLFSKT